MSRLAGARLLTAGLGTLACALPATLPHAGVLDREGVLSGRPEEGRIEIYTRVEAFEGNDWTSMRGISGAWNDRYSPRNGRNLAVAFVRAEVGAARGSWRVSWLRRQEAIIDASRDTIELLYFERNNLPIPAGRRFSIDFDANAIEAEGPKVEKVFELYRGDSSTLKASLGASLLDGRRVRSSSVHGEFQGQNSGSYSLDVSWSDAYTDKTYRFLTPGSPSGSGHSIDAALQFEWSGVNRVSLDVADLDSRITWNDVPATVARANSATATRDAQGYIVYQPAIAGQNARRAFVQRLDPKTTLQYSRTAGAFALGAGALWIRGIAIPRLSLGYRPGDMWRFSIERDFRFGGLGLAARYKWLSIALLSDKLDPGKARALGLAAQLAVSF